MQLSWPVIQSCPTTICPITTRNEAHHTGEFMAIKNDIFEYLFDLIDLLLFNFPMNSYVTLMQASGCSVWNLLSTPLDKSRLELFFLFFYCLPSLRVHINWVGDLLKSILAWTLLALFPSLSLAFLLLCLATDFSPEFLSCRKKRITHKTIFWRRQEKSLKLDKINANINSNEDIK